MGFAGKIGSGWSPTAAAFALVGGEAAGFALTDGSGLWRIAGCVLAHAAVAAWAWRLKRAWLPLVFAAGAVLAWRAEDARKSLLGRAMERGADGGAPEYELRVEGAVRLTRDLKRHGRRVEFLSRVGDLPVKVFAPLAAAAGAPEEGETWRCRGWLKAPGDGYVRYSRHALWVLRPDDAVRVREAGESGARGVYARLSAKLARASCAGVSWSPELSGLVQAIVFGRRAEMPPARKAAFAAAGTVHVFAISGLHVMLAMALLKTFLQLVPGMSCVRKNLIVLPLAAAYVLLTGARPSAVRALSMGAIALAAPMFGRRPDALAAWGVTAACVYALSPALAFDLGCTLSFAVMLGIVLWLRRTALFGSPFSYVLASRCSRAATEEDPESARTIRAWIRRAKGVLDGAGISAAAWLAGTPIAVCAFSRFTVGGLAANLVVVPLSSLVVAFGLAGALAGSCGLALPACAFNNAAACCTWIMACVSERVAAWPGASMRVEPWGVGACAAWYASLFALYACSSARARSWTAGLLAGGGKRV